MSWILFTVLLSVTLGVIAAALMFVRKLEKRSAAAQAERWLAERHAGIGSDGRKWSSRGVRLVVCIPSIFVLVVFSFLPEICGVLTHLGNPQAGSLSGYRVEIPATWIILGHNNRHAEGRSQVSGFVNKGIGRGMNPFQYRELSYWYITAQSFNGDFSDFDFWMSKEDGIIHKQIFTVGSETVVCVEPVYADDNIPGQIEPNTLTHINCSDSHRINAYFDGAQSDVSAFYRLIGGIMPVE